MTGDAALRAFLAVPLSSEIKDCYARLHGDVTRRFRGLRWVRPENLHVTMRFLGDTEERKAETLRRDVATLTAGQAAFRLTLGAPGCYGGRKAPRVVWIGIEKGAEEMRRLADGIELSARQLGFKPETKPWAPHVTVARNREGLKIEGWEEALAASGLSGLGLDVEGVSLMSSRLLPRGPEYSTVWTAPLRRP